jgi:two-component system OmpR family response regulator/two-component system phosphate regulon response regulator OmpR
LDDETSVRKLLVRLLAREGYAIHETATLAEAYEVASSLERLDVWVTDAHVEDRDASREVERFRALNPHLAVVLVSGCEPDCDRADELNQLGVVFLAKPFTPVQLHEAVDVALRHGMAASTTVPLNADAAVALPAH